MRTLSASLALAGHCFAMIGAFALHDVHCGDCCDSGPHGRDDSAAVHDHSADHCAHDHACGHETPGDRGARDPRRPHDHENCGWCRFLAIAATEPQVAETPERGDMSVASVPASRVAPASPLPSQPSVRGPPCC